MTTFHLSSGLLVITDPSELDTKKGLVLSAKKGRYFCSAEISSDSNMVEKLIIKSEGIDESEYSLAMSMLLGKTELFDETVSSVFTQSSMIGLFDVVFYRNKDSVENLDRLSDKIVAPDDIWYSFCCDRSLSKNKWGVIPYGCVGMVGADGFYKVSHFTNNSGIVVKVVIDFSTTIDEIKK